MIVRKQWFKGGKCFHLILFQIIILKYIWSYKKVSSSDVTFEHNQQQYHEGNKLSIGIEIGKIRWYQDIHWVHTHKCEHLVSTIIKEKAILSTGEQLFCEIILQSISFSFSLFLFLLLQSNLFEQFPKVSENTEEQNRWDHCLAFLELTSWYLLSSGSFCSTDSVFQSTRKHLLTDGKNYQIK